MFDPGQRLGPAVRAVPVAVVVVVAGTLMTLLVVGPPVGIDEDWSITAVTGALDTAALLVEQ
jgi:hypothetical protein